MKHIFYLLLLIISLSSTICSCRASRQSSTEYSDTTSVAIQKSSVSLSRDELLSFISASRELDLSGVKIEFFPPDSAHPDARAAPKSMTIENVSAKESTEQTTQAKAEVDEQKTVNLSAQSSTALQQDTKSGSDILRPPDWLFFILGILLSALTIFLRRRKW